MVPSFVSTILIGWVLWFHPFHSSLGTMEFNNKEKNWEISLRFFSDDLETAISTQQKIKRIEVWQGQYLQDYILKKFILQNPNNQNISLHFIGYENKDGVTWVYLEPQGVPPTKFKICHRVLLETFDDQKNMLQIKQGEKSKSILFSVGNDCISGLGLITD